MSKIISIVMPVYNAERFLKFAVESILAQTVFNFECIVIDDGSTDKSFDILNEICDERFLILRHRKNKGITEAVNVGIRRASGEYIVRMDADDIMVPHRLEAQLGFMVQNPLIAISGSYFDYIDEDNQIVGGSIKFPVQPDEVKEAFRKYTAVGHPTVIFRKAVLLAHTDLYSSKYPSAEDLALWLECLSKGLLFANYPEVLLHYRQHKDQIGSKHIEQQKRSTEAAYKDFGDLIWGDNNVKESV